MSALHWIVPGTGLDQDNAWSDLIGNVSADKALPTVVESPQNVTLGNAARSCVLRVKPYRFTARNLISLAYPPIVHLPMQTAIWLVGNKVERKTLHHFFRT